MTKPAFLPVVRELVRCYQALASYSAARIREFGLTPPQFDVVATLSNTPGMTPKELVRKALITKGTLTGIVDRLEACGVVRRVPSPTDGRSQIVRLTRNGTALFDRAFPAQLAYVGRATAHFTTEDLARIETALRDLRGAFVVDKDAS